MSSQLLLCSDLDRTLLPNGKEPESSLARPLLRRLAARSETTLAYVSGRHEQLLRRAIIDYAIPEPAYAIGDVGTTIYRISGGRWQRWQEWEQRIAPDWNGANARDLAGLLSDLDLLVPQEEEKQNRFKLSFYAPVDCQKDALLSEMAARLRGRGIRASLIWSVDEAAEVGLLDVLPESATKLHAVRFVMELSGMPESETVFAGDSGNDLAVLTSGLQSVLVRNAHPEVRDEALREVRRLGLEHKLYLAEGNFCGMNGNYAAGVLEGVAHFLPAVASWCGTAAVEQ